MLQTRTEGKQCRIRAALKLFCQVLSLHRPNSFPVFHTCIILTKKTDNMNCQHAACRITTSSSLEVQNPKGQLQCQVTVQQPDILQLFNLQNLPGFKFSPCCAFRAEGVFNPHPPQIQFLKYRCVTQCARLTQMKSARKKGTYSRRETYHIYAPSHITVESSGFSRGMETITLRASLWTVDFQLFCS